MNKQKQAKVDTIKNIVQKIDKSKAMVVAEYRGLSVKKLQELRSELRKKDVEFIIFKNRLMKLALKESGITGLDENLVGPNGFAFGYTDDISPAKILFNFSKDNEELKIKAGIYEGNTITEEQVKEIAVLPTYDEALTILAMSMMSPLKNMSVSLKMLIDENHIKADTVEAKTETNQKEEEKEGEK
ncbi:MAG: 50S ribosomal protein L10 [Mycoplasma sp.]|nr:50S ribosomal protein L10 [Mycoplasma sp.]